MEFVNAQFEDAVLPHGQFRAVFSASAVHWVDPAVGWRKVADVLAPGGTLALVPYFGLDEQRSTGSGSALAAMRKVAPDIAANWPTYRDLDATLAGTEQRRGNVSAVWAWLGSYDIGQDYVGPCSVMFRWRSCQSSSSTLQTSSMLSFARCRFTLGFHRASGKILNVDTRPSTNDSGDPFALARSRRLSRHGAAPMQRITAHR